MINDALFSSTTDMWETPKDLFDKLDEEFKFQTDVCAIKQNAKCKRFYTPEQNGLKQIWTGVCWCNPPYGRGIEKWMKKAYPGADNGHKFHNCKSYRAAHSGHCRTCCADCNKGRRDTGHPPACG